MPNTPVCPLAKKCGGCQLQNLSYPEQLHLKQALPLLRREHAGLVVRARQALVGRAEDDKVLYAAAAVAVKVTGGDAVK